MMDEHLLAGVPGLAEAAAAVEAGEIALEDDE